MKCPFGREVGNPADINRCPSGFPGCACGDEMVVHLTAEATAQTEIVVSWWEQHGPF